MDFFRKRCKPPDGAGGMTTWINEKGETCIGNKCFHVKADGPDVVVQYNSDDPSCEVDLGKAVDKMFGLIAKGGSARFRRMKVG